VALIARNADGALAVRWPVALGPIGAALGVLVDALAAGAGTTAGAAPLMPGRSLIGILADLAGLGVGVDFVEEALLALGPGAAAVLAEVGEHWLAPVDAAMAQLGGTLIRRQRADTADQQVWREVEALEWELRELEQEAEQASGEAGQAIRRRADATRRRLAATAAQAEAMMARLQAETTARMEALEVQLERASAEVEARVEAEAKIGQAVTRTRAEATHRFANLRQAVALAREALGSDGRA
jgi:hypothetical protein